MNRDAAPGAAEDSSSASQPVAEAPGALSVRHVIVVGFGVAGRSVVNSVIERNVSYTVVETNTATVSRCACRAAARVIVTRSIISGETGLPARVATPASRAMSSSGSHWPKMV